MHEHQSGQLLRGRAQKFWRFHRFGLTLVGRVALNRRNVYRSFPLQLRPLFRVGDYAERINDLFGAGDTILQRDSGATVAFLLKRFGCLLGIVQNDSLLS